MRRQHTFVQTFVRFREYTMIPQASYVANLEIALRHGNGAGSVVECGTWKGGMIAGIASHLGDQRDYWLFDSFEGLPPAKEIDGESAIAWQADTESEHYYDNCSAAQVDAERAMALAGVATPEIVKGWFSETLPRAEFSAGISVLRMDADWYDSTMDILNNLFFKVNPGGVILIDDYYMWDGCSKAVHDFLSKHQRSERIRMYQEACYIIKE